MFPSRFDFVDFGAALLGAALLLALPKLREAMFLSSADLMKAAAGVFVVGVLCGWPMIAAAGVVLMAGAVLTTIFH